MWRISTGQYPYVISRTATATPIDSRSRGGRNYNCILKISERTVNKAYCQLNPDRRLVTSRRLGQLPPKCIFSSYLPRPCYLRGNFQLALSEKSRCWRERSERFAMACAPRGCSTPAGKSALVVGAAPSLVGLFSMPWRRSTSASPGAKSSAEVLKAARGLANGAPAPHSSTQWRWRAPLSPTCRPQPSPPPSTVPPPPSAA